MTHPIRCVVFLAVLGLALGQPHPAGLVGELTTVSATPAEAEPESRAIDLQPADSRTAVLAHPVNGGDARLRAFASTLADVAQGAPSTVLLLLAGYTRWSDAEVLGNETRAAIYERVQESPGAYLSELAEEVEVTLPTVSYHTEVLEDGNYLTGVQLRGKYRLYPLDASPSGVRAALSQEATARILVGVAHHEPVAVSTLAEEVERTESTVSYHLQRLAEDELIVRERDGRVVLTALAPTVRNHLAAEEREFTDSSSE